MAFRKRMNGSASRRSFSKFGSRTHKKNLGVRMPMRGGIRM